MEAGRRGRFAVALSLVVDLYCFVVPVNFHGFQIVHPAFIYQSLLWKKKH